MTSSILIRLQGWRDVAIHGKPAWLAEVAPGIIRTLEAQIAASVGRNPEGRDPEERLGPKDEHAVGEAETPEPGGDPDNG